MGTRDGLDPQFNPDTARELWAMVWRYDLTGANTIGKSDEYVAGWRACIKHLREVTDGI